MLEAQCRPRVVGEVGDHPPLRLSSRLCREQRVQKASQRYWHGRDTARLPRCSANPLWLLTCVDEDGGVCGHAWREKLSKGAMSKRLKSRSECSGLAKERCWSSRAVQLQGREAKGPSTPHGLPRVRNGTTRLYNRARPIPAVCKA